MQERRVSFGGPGARASGLELLAGVVWVAVILAASRSSRGVDLLRFPLAWAGVLVALDGLARWRTGGSPLRSASDWIAAGAASVVFWDVFELVDLRLRNWWYVGVSPNPWARAVFSAVSFATVLPAARLCLAHVPSWKQKAGGSRLQTYKLAAGIAMLAIALAFPKVAFPLAWIFLWPICEGLAGVRIPLRAMAIGLPLGLIWEALNWKCARGWFYAIPFPAGPKVFEMPLLGYLGYLPFALEAAAALALVDRLRPRLRGPARAAALLGVALFHVLAELIAGGQTAASFSR